MWTKHLLIPLDSPREHSTSIIFIDWIKCFGWLLKCKIKIREEKNEKDRVHSLIYNNNVCLRVYESISATQSNYSIEQNAFISCDLKCDCAGIGILSFFFCFQFSERERIRPGGLYWIGSSLDRDILKIHTHNAHQRKLLLHIGIRKWIECSKCRLNFPFDKFRNCQFRRR